MKSSVRRIATWLAFLSVSLYALWPLLATMQPRTNGDGYELCPHAALQHLAEKHGHEKSSSNPVWDNHLLRCAFGLSAGDGASAAPTGVTVLNVHQHDTKSRLVSPETAFSPFNLIQAAAPRGPPVVS